jgi:hypothetical protein
MDPRLPLQDRKAWHELKGVRGIKIFAQRTNHTYSLISVSFRYHDVMVSSLNFKHQTLPSAIVLSLHLVNDLPFQTQSRLQATCRSSVNLGLDARVSLKPGGFNFLLLTSALVPPDELAATWCIRNVEGLHLFAELQNSHLIWQGRNRDNHRVFFVMNQLAEHL